MSTLLRLATLCGATLAAATTARALPLTPVPGAEVSFDANLRPSLAPNLAPWQSWSGFHVGVNIGGAWDGATAADLIALPVSPTADLAAATPLTQSFSANGGGAIGGAQIGYDFDWPFGLVTGVEADFQGLSFKDSAWFATPALLTEVGALMATKRVDYLGIIRLRLGYQVTPGVLFYATGGYAYGQTGFTVNGSAVSVPLNFGAVTFGNFAGLRGGFAVGGGLEYAISPDLIGRVEYLRYDLGAISRQTPFLATDASLQWPGLTQHAQVGFSGNVVRAGLNYRFIPDLAAPILPVVAKY
jgi:outer membrane immunogenic protein